MENLYLELDHFSILKHFPDELSSTFWTSCNPIHPYLENLHNFMNQYFSVINVWYYKSCLGKGLFQCKIISQIKQNMKNPLKDFQLSFKIHYLFSSLYLKTSACQKIVLGKLIGRPQIGENMSSISRIYSTLLQLNINTQTHPPSPHTHGTGRRS